MSSLFPSYVYLKKFLLCLFKLLFSVKKSVWITQFSFSLSPFFIIKCSCFHFPVFIFHCAHGGGGQGDRQAHGYDDLLNQPAKKLGGVKKLEFLADLAKAVQTPL